MEYPAQCFTTGEKPVTERYDFRNNSIQTYLMHNFGTYLTHSDRYKTNGLDEETLEHLTCKLRYPLEDILRAVQEVGADAEEVEEYIRDRYNRC